MKLILASKSPRRQNLLKEAGFRFELRPKSIDESFPGSLPLEEVPVFLAEKKANAFIGELQKDELLISSDTVVILGDQIINKPEDLSDARRMIQGLSGHMHRVITGVCLTEKNKQTSFSEETKVFFKTLEEAEIDYYLQKYKPLDKAGAYGIQEWLGMIGIEKIEGCFYNVMGLPLAHLYQHLKQHYPQLLPTTPDQK